MYSRIYLLVLSFLIFSLPVTGQVSFQKFLDFTGTNNTDVVQTTDSCFVYSTIFGSGLTRPGLVKIDAQGNTLWSKQYIYTPGSQNMENAVIQTSDGGFVVTSSTVIKTNSSGNFLWGKTVNGDFQGSSAVEAANGDIIAVGSVTDPTGNQFTVLKTDASGNVLFVKTFGDPGLDYLREIRTAVAGGYIMAGETSFLGTSDCVLIRMDDAGNIIWSKAYSDAGFDGLYSVQSLPDGSFLAMGVKSPQFTTYSIILIKVDANGDVLWTKSYHDDDTYGYNFHLTPDNKIIVIGRSVGFVHAEHALILNIDSIGDVIWRKKYIPDNNLYYCIFNDMVPTFDGGYFLSGQVTGPNGSYFYNMKTDSVFDSPNFCSQSGGPIFYNSVPYTTVNYPLTPSPGTTAVITGNASTLILQDSTICTNVGLEELNHSEMMIFPNPTAHTLFVKTNSNEPATVFLYDLAGNELLTRTIVREGSLNMENLAQGMYVLKMIQGNSGYWKKIIRE